MVRFYFFHTAILGLLFSFHSAQAQNVFPRGCEVSGFEHYQNYLILNQSGKQSYYLIRNRSNNTVEMEQPATGDAFMTPPLHATFKPMTWGAFAADVKNVNFKCYKQEGDNVTLTNCHEVLDVCQYPRARFALSNMGNYWVAFNQSQYAIIQESVAKGIYLKW